MSNELDMLQDDCNLDEIIDIELDIDGKVMPEKHDKIALIDADTVAYTACLNTEVAGDVLGEEFHTAEEWQEIINSPQYDADEGLLYEVCPIQALAKAEEKLQRILDKTGCKTVELHFSGGRENFRYDVAPDYKANRSGRPPAGLAQLKKDLAAKYEGSIHTKWEADDAYCYKLQKDFDIRNAEREELKHLADTRSSQHTSGEGKYYKTKLYNQWDNMLDRCYGVYKESIAQYQDNNIKVYQPWVDNPDAYGDWAKANGWFDGCSIDRIDYLGHYIPSNIQFISKSLNTLKQNLIDNPKTWIDFERLLRIREERKAGDTWQTILCEDYSENLRSSLTKQLKNIEGFNNQLDYLVSKLAENIKFKLNDRFYICKAGKAESYRDYIGAAIDKDCLNSVATNDICKQFNYYESALYKIEMKWVTVDRHTALTWRYLQTLMGDKTDNIIGLKGIGPAKAAKILVGCMSHSELWQAVLDAYESKGRTHDEALKNLNLVDMKLLHMNDTGELEIKLRTHEELLND